MSEKCSILLVDDDPNIRALLSDMLIHAGYVVATAADGQVALEYLRNAPLPHLILLDLMMPGMNGLQFRVAQVNDARLAAIPVIVMTAIRVDVPSPKLGAVDILWKPFKLDMVLDLVAKYCP